MRNRRYFSPRGAFIIYGFFLLLASVGLGLYIGFVISNGTRKAVAFDTGLIKTSSYPCARAISWELILDKRVMSERETQVLTVAISNNDNTTVCDEEVNLDAPKFDFSPDEPIRTLSVPSSSSVKLSWILEPRELGTFAVTVSITQPESFQTVGVTVTNIFGLNVWQAQLLSSLGTFLGTVLGPILSITWWYKVWQKRKRKKQLRAASPSVPPSAQIQKGPIGKLLMNEQQANRKARKKK